MSWDTLSKLLNLCLSPPLWKRIIKSSLNLRHYLKPTSSFLKPGMPSRLHCQSVFGSKALFGCHLLHEAYPPYLWGSIGCSWLWNDLARVQTSLLVLSYRALGLFPSLSSGWIWKELLHLINSKVLLASLKSGCIYITIGCVFPFWVRQKIIKELWMAWLQYRA